MLKWRFVLTHDLEWQISVGHGEFKRFPNCRHHLWWHGWKCFTRQIQFFFASAYSELFMGHFSPNQDFPNGFSFNIHLCYTSDSQLIIGMHKSYNFTMSSSVLPLWSLFISNIFSYLTKFFYTFVNCFLHRQSP